MRKLLKKLLVTAFLVPILLCGLSTIGVFSNTDNSNTKNPSPVLENNMGGGGITF